MGLLREYQTNAIERLKTMPHACLMADMGTGKTITTLSHIASDQYKALIIAPLTVAQTVWENEAQKWPHTRHLRFAHLLGSSAKRRKAMEEDADVYVINIENAPWLIEGYMAWLEDMEFDILVLDELSLWRNNKSKRWKAGYHLRMRKNVFSQVIGLTGTPAPNGLVDMWAQMQMIKPEVITRHKTQYLRKYFVPLDPNGWKWTLQPNADFKIYRALDPYVIRVSNRELDMPELTEQRVAVPLPEAVTKLMAELKSEGAVEVDKTLITAESAGALVQKLMQLSNGAVYDEDNVAHFVHNEKLKVTEQIINELQGNPALVAYQFAHDLAALRKAYPDAPVLGATNTAFENNRIVREWNAGRIPVLLGHPAAMGHGLNLQEGGHHVIFYGLTWSLEHYEQLIARVYRQGQKSRHVFVHLLCASPIDYRVADTLVRKANMQQALLDFLAA